MTSYESRVQQISAAASEEISRRDSPEVLEEKLQSLNRLWADIARKLGTRHFIVRVFRCRLFLVLLLIVLISVKLGTAECFSDDNL